MGQPADEVLIPRRRHEPSPIAGTSEHPTPSGSATDTITVPTGCSIFPRELQRPSRRWAERRFLDIRYWNEPERGGRFAALEQPQLFVEEIRAFFRLVR